MTGGLLVAGLGAIALGALLVAARAGFAAGILAQAAGAARVAGRGLEVVRLLERDGEGHVQLRGAAAQLAKLAP